MENNEELLGRAVELLSTINDQLTEINKRIFDVEFKLGEMQGNGVYNTLSDVCDKLDEIAMDQH